MCGIHLSESRLFGSSSAIFPSVQTEIVPRSYTKYPKLNQDALSVNTRFQFLPQIHLDLGLDFDLAIPMHDYPSIQTVSL